MYDQHQTVQWEHWEEAVSEFDRFEFFDAEELACKHCGKLKVQYDAVHTLDTLRRWWGAPFHIVSGYRCPDHNAAVGGAQNSYHTLGRAFDIAREPAGLTGCAEVQRLLLINAHIAHEAGTQPFAALGVYDRFIHLDNRRTVAHWEQDLADQGESRG